MNENSSWLIVETYPNWEVDRKNNFTYFGLTGRFEKLAKQIKPGDFLFTYVTGESCFSDVRKLTKPGPRPLKMGGDYDKALPICIDTAPVLVLERHKWIPISTLHDRLSLTAGKKYWSSYFRGALRLLGTRDAAILREKLFSQPSGP